MESWEDEADAQEDLAKRTQQGLNLNGAAQNNFRPGASSFQPGAQSFQPQYQQYQNIPQQGYGGYPQYNQPGYGYNQGYHQYGHNGQAGYDQQYGGYGQSQYQQQPQQPQSQPQQQRAPIQIAKRPSAPQSSQPADSDSSAPPQPKVLSIGTGGSAKIETAGQTRILSVGSTTPAAPAQTTATASNAKAKVESQTPDAGSKVTAAKALEKSGEPPAAAASASGTTSPTPSSGRNSPTPAEQKQAAREAAAVAKEQEADVDEETLREMYGKEHVNVIFLGHVDAGKSTLGGSILCATGMVDPRTLEKLKQEAKAAGRETWYLSWALDLTKEERAQGKTVEVGRGFFETDKRRYSILDAPGHKTYVPNMVSGASQADIGVLVISARKGEFETGFERGGQTREHAILAKTQGVNKLVVAINKMDDPTVEWDQERYDECVKKLTPFLKSLGYNPKTDLMFMPVSGQQTLNIKERLEEGTAPWWDGPALLEYLDSMQALERKVNAPLMMPIAAKYRDVGTWIEGKIEAGVVKKGVSYVIMPNKESKLSEIKAISISGLYGETEDEIEAATCGEQVRIRIRGVEEEDILPGFVLCSTKRPVHCVTTFEAQIVVRELKSILGAGFNCVMHVHSATVEVTFIALLHKLEKGTGRKSKKPPGFAKQGMAIIARLEVTGGAGSVCVERFEDYPQLGRFTLRDQGQSIAIGKITKLITE